MGIWIFRGIVAILTGGLIWYSGSDEIEGSPCDDGGGSGC